MKRSLQAQAHMSQAGIVKPAAFNFGSKLLNAA